MQNDIREKLILLFEKWSGEKFNLIVPLPRSGSERLYFRIIGADKSAVAAYNPDTRENGAFITLANHFYSKGLPVPRIYLNEPEENIYLLEDLGDQTLFSFTEKYRTNERLPDQVKKYYKEALSVLPEFQIEAAKDLDYGVCYPRADFDKQAMLWDLNYFKYYFIKLTGIKFDEQKLEDDFNLFINFLLEADTEYFVYRDFQTRNIMLKKDKLYFIDFQGGRKGALQYDVASLLFSSKANLTEDERKELLDHYLSEAKKYKKINEKKFKKYYHGYVLLRILQALGAYGFRGFYERKDHFLKSIPFALNNIRWLLDKGEPNINLPELFSVLHSAVDSEYLNQFEAKNETEKLKVTIRSFSYKKGIPYDTSGNGGGFVFDCRAIHNPGRYDKYKMMTGKDKPVMEFLEKESEINNFLKEVYALVDKSVNVYQSRGFTDLMVNFGCTGGQHRSVYCAEALAKHLNDNYDTDINIKHIELKNNPVLRK